MDVHGTHSLGSSTIVSTKVAQGSNKHYRQS